MVSSARKTVKYLQGDRFRSPLGEGIVTNVKKKGIFPYEITWWNGQTGLYSAEQIERYGYQHLPPEPDLEDIEEEEAGLFDGDFSREQNTEFEVLALIQSGIGDTTNLAAKSSLSMLAIAPVLKNLETQGKIERKNYLWWPKCSDNLTSAQVLVSDSPSQDSKSEGLPLLDYAKLTTTAEISSPSDSQACESLETSSDTTGNGNPLEEPTSLQLPLLANLSQSKESDSQQMTSETVSPTSSKRSPKSNRRTLRSKTSRACSVALTDPDTKSDTSAESSPTFPSAGTMSNGSWSAADTLDRPSLESGCSWLESPSGLSAVGRVPGQSRLEAQLKSEQHLEDGQTINPAFLEDAFEIPLGWCDRLVSRPAIQLLEESEKRSVTVLTLESPPLHSAESSTLTESLKTEEELTPVDESAVGRHYWCDRYTVTVQIEAIHNWRETPRSPEIIKAARCRPWWTKDKWGNEFPEIMVLKFEELVEIEEFSCPVRSLDAQVRSLEKSLIPEIPIPGISPNPKPVTESADSLEKLEFYVTVSCGLDRPQLMPDDLFYLFPASSFWNRSRAAVKSFPRCPKFPAGAVTAADSGGYVAATKWGGKYPYTPAQYVEWLAKWKPQWAATMDYCCEQPLTGGDRRKIRHRQKQTTKLAWLFWNKYRGYDWQWVPTVQGWDTEDYIHHAQELKPLIEEMRQGYGESFRVGIGTLCARTSNSQIKEIAEAVSGVLPGIKFHLWGVKQDAAPVLKNLPQVVSSDSAAWDGMAGSRCRRVWEEEYKGKITQAEYRWTVGLPKYLDSLERKLGCSVRALDTQSHSLEKPENQTTKQVGSLYQYTANKADKVGSISTYPKVEGDRSREEDSHWYWGFSYVEKQNGKWRDKSAAVPRKKLSEVREALRAGKNYTYILQQVLGKD